MRSLPSTFAAIVNPIWPDGYVGIVVYAYETVEKMSFVVSRSSRWKEVFALGAMSAKHENSGELKGWWEDPGDPVHVLNRCARAMNELWRDPAVRERLAEKRIRLEESSGLCVFSPLAVRARAVP